MKTKNKVKIILGRFKLGLGAIVLLLILVFCLYAVVVSSAYIVTHIKNAGIVLILFLGIYAIGWMLDRMEF